MARSGLKAKGRQSYGSYVAVPKAILESEEYAALTAFEVKLLMDIYAQFNGRNNGDMHCAWALMKKRGWASQDTLNRALRGLLSKGFVEKTRQGGRHLCSLFAVSWLAIDDCKRKLDVGPTRVASGLWKNKSVLRQPEHITTGGVVMEGTRCLN